MNKQIKVLVCAPLPPPTGGIATWVSELIDSNHSNDTDINFFNTANRKHSGTFSAGRKLLDGSKVIYKQLTRFNKELNEDVDIVHLSSSGGFAHARDILFSILCKIKRKKIVLQLHYGVGDSEYKWEVGASLMYRVASFLADRVLVLDQKYYEGSDSSKYRLSFNGSKPIDKHILGPKAKEILFVGWVIEQKGIFELVTAWNSIKDKNGWHLSIIGSSQETEKLKLLDMLDLQTSSYLGELPRSEVLSRMEDASVLALPSHTEGFPFAMIEGMQHKLALLVTDVGGISQVFSFDRNPGWLVPYKNLSMLSKNLRSIVNDFDEVLIRAANSKYIFENHFTNEIMYKNLLQNWKSVLN